jgi:hypothetical protein
MAEAGSPQDREGEVELVSPRSSHSMEDMGISDSHDPSAQVAAVESAQVAAVESGSEHEADGEDSDHGSAMDYEAGEEDGDSVAASLLAPSDRSYGTWVQMVEEEAARAAQSQDHSSDTASQHSDTSEASRHRKMKRTPCSPKTKKTPRTPPCE